MIDSLTVTTYLATSLPVDITDLRKSDLPVLLLDANLGIGVTFSDLQNTGGDELAMNTNFPTEVDDITRER